MTVKVKIVETVDVEKQLPNCFKKGSSRYIHICKGFRGGTYQLIERKSGKKELYSCSTTREIKDFEIINS